MYYSIKLSYPVAYVAVGVVLAGLCALTPGKYVVRFGRVALPLGVVLSYLSICVFYGIALASVVSMVRGMLAFLRSLGY